jgi:lipoprotein-anchoring transpeptidase ErfK/SrfK
MYSNSKHAIGYAMKYFVSGIILFLTLQTGYARPIELGLTSKVNIDQHKPSKAYSIEINISQCKLTLYEKNGPNSMVPVQEYKVGTAVRGLEEYPIGKGRVTCIELNPSWRPTKYTREIYEKKGIELPRAVPPGHPLNYMGPFKIYLSHSTSHGSIYRIHGNNNKSRVGKRVTGGFICMDNDEGLKLTKIIPVGTEVNIVM